MVNIKIKGKISVILIIYLLQKIETGSKFKVEYDAIVFLMARN